MTDGRRAALSLVARIVAVNLFRAGSAIFGIAAVCAVFRWFALLVKLAGAACLVWFGIRLFGKRAGPAGTTDARRTSGWHSFRRGITVDIANPKSIAYYAAVFSAATPTYVSIVTFAAMLSVVALVGATR